MSFKIEGVPYGPYMLTIEADTLEVVHEAAAGVEELNRDYRMMQDEGYDDIQASFKQTKEGHLYYGWKDRHSADEASFGKKKDQEAIVPFFPKQDLFVADNSYSGGDGQSRGRTGGGNDRGASRGSGRGDVSGPHAPEAQDAEPAQNGASRGRSRGRARGRSRRA